MELLLLYRITRSTGISLSKLGRMDAQEVEVMLSIERSKIAYYSEKLNEIASIKHADVSSARYLALLVEEKLII